MHSPKGPKDSDLDCEMKKSMLKKLKHTMDKAAMRKINAKNQEREQVESKFVSSVEPTYPGFKNGK